jgi:hypothetical protein
MILRGTANGGPVQLKTRDGDGRRSDPSLRSPPPPPVGRGALTTAPPSAAPETANAGATAISLRTTAGSDPIGGTEPQP